MVQKKISTELSGIAGEHSVAAELSKRGYLASIMLRNAKGVDIMVYNEKLTKSAAIQVKTNQGYSKGWILKESAENLFGPEFFYVFVNLGTSTGSPEFHIIPSKVVAKYIKESHRDWLNTPGQKGQKRNDSSMRKFFDEKDEYLGKWELLGLE